MLVWKAKTKTMMTTMVATIKTWTRKTPTKSMTTTVDGDDKDDTHGKTVVVDGDVICYVCQHGTMECI